MNQKLFNHIQTTASVKPFMDDVIDYARSNQVHIDYAISQVLESSSLEDLTAMLVESDNEAYIWSELDDRWAENARRVLLDQIHKWFVAIGQDLKEFVDAG